MAQAPQYPEPVVLAPTAGAQHTHTVVFLHGRGDTAPKFSSSLRYSVTSQNQTLADAFPSFRWVFPHAPIEQSVCPGFGAFNKTSQWFDIWNVHDFSDREELQAEGLSISVSRIRDLIHHEACLLGGRYDRIVLMGISQGAATAAHTLLHLDLPHGAGLAAFVGFSCRMPFPGRSLAETRAALTLPGDNQCAPDHATVLEKTPMLLEHCVNDPLVLVEKGRVLRDTLRGFGATVHWREYPGGGHWFNSPQGIDDVVDFLKTVLAGRREWKTAQGKCTCS